MNELEQTEYEEAIQRLEEELQSCEQDIFLLRLEIANRGLIIERLTEENEGLRNKVNGVGKNIPAIFLPRKEPHD